MPIRLAATKTLTVNGVTVPYLTFTLRRAIGTTNVTCHIEFGQDLTTWSGNGVRVSGVPNGDGTQTELWRAAVPTSAANPMFAPLRMRQP